MPKLLPALLLVQFVAAQGSVEWMQRGQQEYAARQYANAVSSLSMAISKDPSNDTAHYYLGNALLRINHVEHALQEYQRAFATTRSPEMENNCRRVLATYHIQLPRKESSVLSNWRQRFSAPATTSVQQLNSEAEHRQSQVSRRTDSHSDGVDVWKMAPENSGPMGVAWNRWIEDFRMQFEAVFARELGVKRPAAWGRTKMVFSVDQNHKLRSRIVTTDAPDFFNEGLLDATRRLDGNSRLSFPSGTMIQGFNFQMGWDYGVNTKAKQDVMASLMQTRGTIRNGLPSANSAVAGKLANENINGKLLNKGGSGDVTGKLASEKTTGKLLDKEGTAAVAGSLNMPSFSTDVSGLILPKAKPVELKATPAKSLDDVAKQK